MKDSTLYQVSGNRSSSSHPGDEAMLQRDIDALWPGCSLIFNRRLLTVIDNEVNRNATENLIYYYHPDHLGSSNTLTDITGLPFQHMEYMPFGETFVEENIGSYSTPYRFTSKELDDETGLVYFGARYYDPKISMWLGVDLLTDCYPGFSPYNYCYNNPLSFVDDWGLWGKKKAERKHDKAVKEYGNKNVGHVYQDKDGEYGFRISMSGFRQTPPSELDKNSDASADGGTPIFNNNSFANFSNYGYDAGLNYLQRASFTFYQISKHSFSFWNDYFGGPKGTDLEKTQYWINEYAYGNILVIIGQGSKAIKKSIEIPKGYKKVRGARSHGSPIFTNGSIYISPDNTGHKTNGVWKGANSIENLSSKKTRLGTFDSNLQRVGD